MKYRFAVFGDPVAHSKSPTIHLRFAEETGLDVCYEKVRVSEDDFARAVTDFFATGGHGLNITVPHKWSAFKMASQLSAEALMGIIPTVLGCWMIWTDLVGRPKV